MTALARTGAS